MKNKKFKTSLSFVLKILVGLFVISPILLGLSLSFMAPTELASVPPHIIPENAVTYTYAKAMSSVPLFGYMANSFIVCGIVIIGQIITCCLAAYAFAFYNFKGQKLLFIAILATMMIPMDSIIIANFLTVSQLKLNDTYLGLVMPYLTSAMGIFLMRQSFMTIPKELKEAATMDGCGSLRFLFNIVVPVSVPAIASLSVYIFIQVYNQYLWPLLVTNKAEMRTVQIGMTMLREAEAVDYGVVLAGSVVTLIPAIVVFIVGQKYLVKGMTAGAVKG